MASVSACAKMDNFHFVIVNKPKNNFTTSAPAAEIIQVGGFNLYESDQHFIKQGSELALYQSGVREEAYKHLQRFRTAIDIGGHIGIFSRDFATRFECVHTFEPMPYNFKLLEMNLKAFSNSVRHNCGIGARQGLIEMRYNFKNSGGSESVNPKKIFDSDLSSSESDFLVAEVKTLDSFDIYNIDLIKIDVQGMDPSVLTGSLKTLKRESPLVIVEEKRVKSRPNDSTAIDKARNILNSVGYKPFVKVNNDVIFKKDIE